MIKSVYIKRILILFLSFYTVNYSNAQLIDNTKDLKVGVVLSGGGAKGLAHIGALQVIEEAGIHIDYIGGTSMGAIIGGLYATGYSASELEQIIPELRFDTYMENTLPRKVKPFIRKEMDDKYILRLPIKDKILLIPRGINKGHRVINKISRYTEHVNDIDDFSQLHIPFLCIATDLEKGEQVILNKGYLPKALRASSAYPTLVTPAEIEGRILVDGGIVNNFPVDEVLAMGADIIIGVDVSSNQLKTKENLQSLPDIIDQLVSYQMVNEENKKKKDKTAIYIRPNMEAYSVISFDSYQEIIEEGKQATLPFKEKLDSIAKLQFQKIKPKINKSTPKETFQIESIEVRGNVNYSYAYIKEKLQIRLGKKLSYDDFYRGIDRLSATDRFNSIQHKITEGIHGKKVSIEVVENPIRTHLQLGLHYDHLYKAGVLLNVTTQNLLFKNDHISADLIIGDKFRYNFNYFIDNGLNLSLGLQAVSQNFDYNTNQIEGNSTFDSEMNHFNLIFRQYTNRIFVQAVFKDNTAVGFGVRHDYMKAITKNFDLTVGHDDFTFINSAYFNPYAFLKYDSFDDKTFPKSGLFFYGNTHWYIGAADTYYTFNPFAQVQLKIDYAYTLFDKLTTQIGSEAGISLGINKNPFLDFHLGGDADTYLSQFVPFYGYDFASMGNNSFLKMAASLRYEWHKDHFISALANFAVVGDHIPFQKDSFDDLKRGFGLQYGVKTLAGPISLTYSYSPEIKNSFWSFKIGYWF